MSAATDEREYPDQLTGWAAPSVERPPTPAEPAAAPLDRLLAALERHIAAEDEVLTSYRALVESTTDPVVALLLRHVGGEEERHHGRLRGIATRCSGPTRLRRRRPVTRGQRRGRVRG
jgi:broad specificity phosphatase PhoE